MNLITFPLPLFRQNLRNLTQRPIRTLRCPVGISRWLGNTELIAGRSGGEAGRTLLISRVDSFNQPQALPPDCAGVLLLGYARQRGRAIGLVRLGPDHLEPIHLLRLVGPGMHTISLQEEASGLEAEKHQKAQRERWSRTIGALGMETWERLVGLRYGVVGMGRTGSGIALSLARLGARRLTLIDPDRVELHNLGEMQGVTDADIGRPKAEAVAESISRVVPFSPEIVTVSDSITRLSALQAAQACDVLVSCADHDGARLAATAIATLFCKPLIDTATGVHGHGRERLMGVDVRLVLPGRCLLCFGGLRNEAEARQVLSSADAESAFYAGRNWQHERSGSLASLNQYAGAIALRLLEDLIAERIQESVWTHVEFDAWGHLTVSYPGAHLPGGSSACRMCDLTGWGEDGLSRVVEFFQQENS